MNDCLFCKIAAQEVLASIRYETDEVLAFDDIHPKADVHIVVIPKRHISRLSEASAEDLSALQPLWAALQDIGAQLHLEEYRVRMNNGAAYGQTIAHLHLHLLSGQRTEEVV